MSDDIKTALIELLTIDEVNHIAARASDIRKGIYKEHEWDPPERNFSAGDVRCILAAWSELP